MAACGNCSCRASSLETCYKYRVKSRYNDYEQLKCDPYAFRDGGAAAVGLDRV